jgi:hypothetical protein
MRSAKISTAKIIQHLANTNRQNSLYYGTTNAYPCCLSMEETFQHVLLCPNPRMAESRKHLLDKLFSALQNMNCPVLILNTLQHGFQCWQSQSASAHAPTSGQLGALETILATALQEQFHSICWHQMCLGYLSKK